MKKTVLTVGIAMLFVVGSATFIGCGNSENHDNDAHEHAEGEGHEHAEGEDHHEHAEGGEEHSDMEVNADEHASYQCPMKCEGDKTYEEEGECPKCGMDIALLEE